MIEVHTDGSCLGNPGPGGWATIVFSDGNRQELHGREEHTTNNRMEMTAVIRGLQALPHTADVTIYSDSRYVINTMTQGWKRKANQDLWEEMDREVKSRRVKWQWVKGHAGNKLNERADFLANGEAASFRQDSTGNSPSLSHLDESGTARMVDVGAKPVTGRVAVARGSVTMKPETLALIRSDGFEKGDVLGVARVAGVMAAKNTALLIPLCHPLPVDVVKVDFHLDTDSSRVNIEATAKTSAKTGVEMEAMTAVSVSALTIYDMCKSADRAMRIEAVRLVKKAGGKSGDLVLEE